MNDSGRTIETLPFIGRMLYWAGSILAVGILLADLLVACDEEPHAPWSSSILIGYAFIVWLVGWICRRVLSRPPAT
jgi:hypothetical protein